VATSGMVPIHDCGRVMPLNCALFHFLHHACAISYRVLSVVISNFMIIQPVIAAVSRGTVFAFFLVYFVNPEKGGYKQNE
jgi:hypothetical protein